MTRITISRIWARAQEIFQNPDIHQFALCQPARPPPEKGDVWTTQEMERTMMEFATLVHISSPSLREGPSGSLLMLLECGNHALELFAMMGGAWERQWHERSTMMSTSPTNIAHNSTALCVRQLGCCQVWSIT